jgi:hypothetical protein
MIFFMKTLILLLGLMILFTGCRTAPPVRSADFTEGHWRGKALIKDLKEAKSYVVNLNLNAVRNERARMDVVSSLGTGVAVLTADDSEVRYMLMMEKKFFTGTPSTEVMRPILMIPFDPRWLHNVLFEVPFLDKSWSCQKDNAGFLSSCENASVGLKVTWSNRQGEKKTVLIEHSRASVQINLATFKPKVEDRKNLFALEAPSNYRKFRVK